MLLRDTSSAVVRAQARAGLGCVALWSGNHQEAVTQLELALADRALPKPVEAAAADALGRAWTAPGSVDTV